MCLRGWMEQWERITHSSKATALSNNGSRNGRDENGKLGAKNNFLQVEKHVSESGTGNLGNKSSIRLLAKWVWGLAVCSAAMCGHVSFPWLKPSDSRSPVAMVHVGENPFLLPAWGFS